MDILTSLSFPEIFEGVGQGHHQNGQSSYCPDATSQKAKKAG